jgi:hypothetical protein
MAAKDVIVKNYVVWLSGNEREQLATLIRKRKKPGATADEGAGLGEGGRLERRRRRER